MRTYGSISIAVVILSCLFIGCSNKWNPPSQANQSSNQGSNSPLQAPELGQKTVAESPSKDAYGLNIAATPYSFTKLTPAEKAGLHWMASQEYTRLHTSRPSDADIGALAKIHGLTIETVLQKINHWPTPNSSIQKLLGGLPYNSKGFEDWRAEFIERNNPTRVESAVLALEQSQRTEQEQPSSTLEGCEWMTGKYYVHLTPTSLCTPIISGCIEGDCTNGHGTYTTYDGYKYPGYFKNGFQTEQDLAALDTYGSNVSATPYSFVQLTPTQQAALHWVATQEYIKLHDIHLSPPNLATLASVHDINPEEILQKVNHWRLEAPIMHEIINTLPYAQPGFERWRARTIERQNTPDGIRQALISLGREQKYEKQHSDLHRSGCGWMTGKYYMEPNPSSLCIPLSGPCIEGNCTTGQGTYVSIDGTKYKGTFEDGIFIARNKVYPPKLYISGTCIEGDCANGRGTYEFSDGSKYTGDFNERFPHGNGTKTWMIGLKFVGEFDHGMPQGSGYTLLPRKNLKEQKCVEGDCKNGQGIMEYPNDTKYVGTFRYGNISGEGIYLWRNGEALSGNFEHGQLKKGDHIYPDGSRISVNKPEGWLKTYTEERDAAELKYVNEHLRERILDAVIVILEMEAKAQEEAHREYCYGPSPPGLKFGC